VNELGISPENMARLAVLRGAAANARRHCDGSGLVAEQARCFGVGRRQRAGRLGHKALSTRPLELLRTLCGRLAVQTPCRSQKQPLSLWWQVLDSNQ
jgi:hypothetical protein